MKTFRHFAGSDFFFKFRPRDAAFEPDVQFRAGRGIGNEPHLGLRLAVEFGGLGCGRMDLERKFFARIKNFAEQGKPVLRRRFARRRAVRPDDFPSASANLFPASGPLAMTLASPGRSLISQDSPIGLPGGSFFE